MDTVNIPEEQELANHCQFPFEVLTHIFYFLPAKARGNVRLTCSDWYDACNTLKILKTEKFKIRLRREHSKSVFRTLKACRSKCMNLEFHSSQFVDSSIPFWENCGDRILSLAFCQCSFGNDIFLAILETCTNLQYLEINSINLLDLCCNAAILYAFDHCNVVKPNLITLKLRKFHYMTDYLYTRITQIFPNIQELLFDSVSINFNKRADSRFYKPDEKTFDSDDIFSFTCVYNHLKLNASKIKKLSLHSVGDRGLTQEWARGLGELPELKLKELSLEEHYLLTEPLLNNFLSKQTELRKIRIHNCGKLSWNTAHCLMENCSKLKYLDLPLLPYPKQFVFHFFTPAKLKRLFSTMKRTVPELEFQVVNKVQNIQNSCIFTYVKSKQEYILFINNMYNKLISLILLTEEDLTDADFQLIFDKLTNLRTLKVSIGSNITDYAFTGKVNQTGLKGALGEYSTGYKNVVSIRNLTRLGTLHIIERTESRITERTINEFFFPCLKILHLSFRRKLLNDMIFKLMIHNVRALEYFIISSEYEISMDQFTSMLQCLKKLIVIDAVDTLKCEHFSLETCLNFLNSYKGVNHLRLFRLPARQGLLHLNLCTKEWSRLN